MINKAYKNLIISIILITILLCTSLAAMLLIGSESKHELSSPIGQLAGSSIVDNNGKVDSIVDNTTGGEVPSDAVAISTEQELKDFLVGSNSTYKYGYLTTDIPNFNWGVVNNRVGSTATFGKDRVFNGNGYKVTLKMPPRVDGSVHHYNYLTFNNWDKVTSSPAHGYTLDYIDASSAFIAVNQGSIKNVNFHADFTQGNYHFSHYAGQAESRPIAFGLITGINFGYVNNCYLLQEGDIKMHAMEDADTSYNAQSEINIMELGGYAGLNIGQIMFSTAEINGTMHAESDSRSSGVTGTKRESGSRSSVGGFVGRMLSDRNANVNQVKLASASVYNCIIKGTGKLRAVAYSDGGGSNYRHTGAVVGSNSYYSGTPVASRTGVTGQNVGNIDGIISLFTGTLDGTTSGSPVGNNAMVDCGRISNVTFLREYDGQIDNCNCDPSGNAEHSINRVNTLKFINTNINRGEIKIGFDVTSPNTSTIVAEVVAGNGTDDIIYDISKRDRLITQNGQLQVANKATSIFNYDSSSYYSTLPGENNKNKATVKIVEQRVMEDAAAYALEVSFGRAAKASFVQPSDAALKYDGASKIKVDVKYVSDPDGRDTLVEQSKYTTFKSMRTYMEQTSQVYGLKMPGSYTNISIVSTLSDQQAYVDPEHFIVAPAVNLGTQTTIRIDPADIIIVDNSGSEVNNTDIMGANGLPLSSYTFRFKVFQDKAATNKVELQGQQFNMIQYTNQGNYGWQNVSFTMDSNYNVTATLPVSSSTSEAGRNYRFRALMNGEPVSSGSIIYKLYIDNEPPEVTITAAEGYSFDAWSSTGYNMIIKSLVDDIDSITVNGSSANVVTVVSGMEYTYLLDDNSTYNISIKDRSGNETIRVVNPKIDIIKPVLNVGTQSKNDQGNIVHNIRPGSEVFANIEFQLTIANLINMPCSMQYAISFDGNASGSEWRAVPRNNIVVADRMYNPNYVYSDQEGGNEGIFDYYHFRIVMETGDVYNITTIYNYRINKKVIELDYDTIEVQNGAFINYGIDDSLKRREYNGKDTAPTALAMAISNAVNKIAVEGDRSNANNKVQVTARYEGTEVGEWNIIIDIYDPLEIYTISNKQELVGKILPAGVDIIVENSTREYGMDDPEFEVTFNRGLLIDDEKPYVPGIKSNTDKSTPVGSYNINVPKVSTVLGVNGDSSYRIRSVNKNASLNIVPQVLNNIDYNDEFLNMNYNGSGQEIEAKYVAVDGSKSNLDVQYFTRRIGDDGVYIIEPMPEGELPTEIMTYRGILSIQDTTNYILAEDKSIIDFEIHKSNVNVSIDPNDLVKTYNGEEHFVNATLSNGVTPSITYYMNGDGVYTEERPINAGTYSVRVDYDNTVHVGEEGNYYSVTETYELVINRANYDNSGLMFTGETNKVYDGEPASLAIEGIPNGTTIKTTGGNLNDMVDGRFELFEETDAGRYSMTISLSNPNYTDKTYNPTLSINLASFTDYGVVVDGITKVTYNGKEHTLQLANIPVDTQILSMPNNNADIDTASVVGKNAGKYNFYVLLRNKNFIEQRIETQLVIDKAVYNNVVLQGNEKTYDGREIYLSVYNVPEPEITKVKYLTGGTPIEVVADDNGVFNLPSKVNAGAYTEMIYLENPNYIRKDYTARLSIMYASYRQAGVSLDNVSVVYNGNQYKIMVINVPINTKFYDMDTDVEISNELTATDAGTYNLRVKLRNPNYSDLDSEYSGKLVITPAANSFTYKFDDKTVSYNGNAHSHIFDESQLPQGFTADYNASMTYTNAGTYTINVIIKSNNYSDKVVSSKLIIEKSLSPNADKFIVNDINVEYNGSIHELVVNSNGVSDIADYKFTMRYTGDNLLAGKPMFASDTPYVGTVTIVHPNYIDIIKVANIKINPKEFTGFSLEGVESTYDAKSHPAILTNGEDNTGCLIQTTYNGKVDLPVNAGRYDVVVTISMLNYRTLVLTSTVIINKANMPSGMAIDAINKEYDGKESTINVSNKPRNSKVTSEQSLSYTDAGEYDVTVTVSDVNYLNITLSTKVVITPKLVEVTYIGEQSFKADGVPNITAQYIDIDGKQITTDVIFPAEFTGKKAGNYTALPNFGTNNYKATESTANFEFTLTSTVNVGAAVGGSVGGAVLIGGIIAAVVLLKKKIIKI